MKHFVLLSVILGVAVSACSQEEQDGQQAGGQPPAISLPDEAFTDREGFQQEIAMLMDEYMQLKEALSGQHGESVEQQARALKAHLENIDTDHLTEQSATEWQHLTDVLIEDLEVLTGADTPDGWAAHFYAVTDLFIMITERFTGPGQTLYLQVCDEAFQQSGAHWLSYESDIRNPYDPELRDCGETVTELP